MRGVLAAAFCFLLSPVVAHTQSDELAVVEHLVRMIMSSPEWEDTPRVAGDGESGGCGLTPLFNEYEELFSCAFPSNHVGFSWSPQERRVAFENFIAAIPELSTNGQYRAIATHGGVALEYCRSFGVSNVLHTAMRILRSPRSVAQSSALAVFKDFAVPTPVINDYVEGIATNEVESLTRLRRLIIDGYAYVLLKNRDITDAYCFTNGVSILNTSLRGRDGAVSVDHLMLAVYPEYELSSNRFALALSALSDERTGSPFNIQFVDRYFAPITNQLLNATQPLLEVEALRGL